MEIIGRKGALMEQKRIDLCCDSIYKAIYSPSIQQMIGFVLPNEKGKKILADYAVSVDSVETLTGIDFFPQLPDTQENRLEARSSYQTWD